MNQCAQCIHTLFIVRTELSMILDLLPWLPKCDIHTVTCKLCIIRVCTIAMCDMYNTTMCIVPGTSPTYYTVNYIRIHIIIYIS